MNVRTISRCFTKCGFNRLPVNTDLPIITNPEEMELQNEENEDGGIFPSVVTPEVLFDEAIANVSINEQRKSLSLEVGIDQDSEFDNHEVVCIPISKAALEAIQVLQMYALGRGDDDVLNESFMLENYIRIVAARNTQEQSQSKISDYFLVKPKGA